MHIILRALLVTLCTAVTLGALMYSRLLMHHSGGATSRSFFERRLLLD
jgi:hypothetical protein